mmetsp:Transcript_12689/g.18516  ORF Transcript_12689/g.18516 Transcript_12689/m.18516 type:complete len:274 (-) Transcript_12689:716-1537(-)
MSYVPPTSVQARSPRDFIVGQLKQYFPEVKVNKSGLIEVKLQLPPGPLFIEIKLGSNFPSQPPEIYVASLVTHPLVGEKQAINYKEKFCWSPNIPILQVVQNIYYSFYSNPPKVKKIQETPSTNLESYTARLSEPLVEEEDYFDFVYTQIDQVKQLVNKRDNLLALNTAKTESLLEKKQEYEELLENHQEDIVALNELSSELKEKMNIAEQQKKSISQEGIISQFQSLEQRLRNSESEVLNSFFSGDASLEEFIKQLTPIKTQLKFISLCKGS